MDDVSWETRIEQKLDQVGVRLGGIDVTLAAQHVSLVDHMKRTELLESRVVPLEKRKWMVDGILKAVGGLCVLATALEGVVTVLTWLAGVLK